MLAGPASQWYRLRKFVRRNKGRVLAAAALAVSLLAGTAAVLTVEAKAERERAAVETERATRLTCSAVYPPTLQPLQAHLIVQQVANGAIELGGISAPKHHRQVIAVLPVGLGSELYLDELVEACARQRVRDADTDVIRLRGAQQLAGREDVR